MLRRKRAQRSWKNMQKFEITVEKQVIVFLDVLSKEPMTHICQASLRGPINSVKHEFIVNLSARPIPTRQTPDYPCKSSLCHALLEFCDLILFGFPCSFPNKRFSLMLPYVAHVVILLPLLQIVSLPCFICLVHILQGTVPETFSLRSVISRIAEIGSPVKCGYLGLYL